MPKLMKTAFVTGASRGIGRAIAFALARGGAHVLVHYGKSEKDADAVVTAIRSEFRVSMRPSGAAGIVEQTYYRWRNELATT